MSGNFLKIAALATTVALAVPTGGTSLAAGAGLGTAASGAIVGTTGAAVTGGSAVSAGLFGTSFTGMQALSLGGTLLKGFGQYQEGQQAASTAEYNSRIQEVNSLQAQRDAKLSRLSAAESAQNARDEARRRVGSIRAAQAKSGVVTSEGSPLLVQTEQTAEGELGARKELYSGELNAQAFTQESAVAKMRAQSLKQEAKTARTGSYLSAGTTLLSGSYSVLK